MAFNPKLNYSTFSPVIDKEFVRKESGLGVADRQEYKELHKRSIRFLVIIVSQVPKLIGMATYWGAV